MNVQFMFLANAAEVRDSLLYVIGGTWDNVYVKDFPVAIVGALVVRLRGDDLGGAHGLKVEVFPESGGPRQTIEGEFESKPKEGSWDPAAMLSIPLTGVPILQAGFHVVALEVDGEQLGNVRFNVTVTT